MRLWCCLLLAAGIGAPTALLLCLSKAVAPLAFCTRSAHFETRENYSTARETNPPTACRVHPQLTRHFFPCCRRRLVSDDILGLVHGGALMVYVGKQRGFHTRTQDEIHDLLLHFTREGATVIR